MLLLQVNNLRIHIITSPTKGDGRLCFRWRGYVGRHIGIYICVFVNNFLVQIQVRLSPNVVSRTLGYRGHPGQDG